MTGNKAESEIVYANRLQGQSNMLVDKDGKLDMPSGNTLVVGDLHFKARKILPFVEKAVGRESVGETADRVVLVGDYCDDWGTSDEEALTDLDFLVSWVQERRREGVTVDCLVGNHDYAAYWCNPLCSGTRVGLWAQECERLEHLDLCIATCVADILVTHAGLTARWASRAGMTGGLTVQEAALTLNGMWESVENDDRIGDLLNSVGHERGGWGLPGPLWAGVGELAKDRYPGLRQIVGHTPVSHAGLLSDEFPELIRNHKIQGCDIEGVWVCDTFSTVSSGRPIGDGSCLLVSSGGDVRSVDLRHEKP